MLQPSSYQRANPNMSSPTHAFKDPNRVTDTPFGYTFHPSDNVPNQAPSTTGPADKLNFASTWEPDSSHTELLSPNEWQSLDAFFLNPDQHLPQGSFSHDPQLPLVLDVFSGTNPEYTDDQAFSMPMGSGMHTAPLKDGFGLSMATMPDPSQSMLHRRHTEGDVQGQQVLGYNLGSPMSQLLRPDSTHSNFATGDMFDMSHTTGAQRPLGTAAQNAMHEPLGVMLPNNSQNGSMDPSLSGGFSQPRNSHVSPINESDGSKANLKRSYSYGTDKAFNTSGFIPDSNRSTHQAVERRLMRDLTVAQPATKTVLPSAANTQPSSPIAQDFTRRNANVEASSEQNGVANDRRDSTSRPAKKRKGKAAITKREEEEEPAVVQEDPVGSRGRGRRRSAVDKKKDNLSEEQKRTNHIISEQKRRGVIKEGYNELLDIVPGLKNAGLNKAALLAETFKFLEDLIQKNQELERLIQNSASSI